MARNQMTRRFFLGCKLRWESRGARNSAARNTSRNHLRRVQAATDTHPACKSWAPYRWIWLAHVIPYYGIPHLGTVYARNIGGQHSTCCWRDLCNGPEVWSQYSIVFWTCSWGMSLSLQSFTALQKCQWSMLIWNVVYWPVLHLVLDSTWIWCSLLLLSWRYLHWLDIEISYRVFGSALG